MSWKSRRPNPDLRGSLPSDTWLSLGDALSAVFARMALSNSVVAKRGSSRDYKIRARSANEGPPLGQPPKPHAAALQDGRRA